MKINFKQRIAKNILKEYKLFYAVRISISLAILSEIFIQIDYFFWESCKKKVGVFFWTQCSKNIIASGAHMRIVVVVAVVVVVVVVVVSTTGTTT